MKKDIYWYITILAMIAMPAAAAINFGDAAYDSLILNTTLILALIGGVATGLGFEAIGILAGHNAIKFYSQKDSRWIIAALALIAYVCIGSYELREIAFARFVPLLSGLVYIMAGLQYQAQDEKQEAKNEQSANREIEILNIQLEHERQMKQDELNAQVKIERVKSKVKSTAIPRQDMRQDSGNLPNDWRQLNTQQKYNLAHSTREERDYLMPEMAERTRREWHKRLDEIAAQNGEFVV